MQARTGVWWRFAASSCNRRWEGQPGMVTRPQPSPSRPCIAACLWELSPTLRPHLPALAVSIRCPTQNPEGHVQATASFTLFCLFVNLSANSGMITVHQGSCSLGSSQWPYLEMDLCKWNKLKWVSTELESALSPVADGLLRTHKRLCLHV